MIVSKIDNYLPRVSIFFNFIFVGVIQQQHHKLLLLDSQISTMNKELKELNFLLKELKEMPLGSGMSSLDAVSGIPSSINGNALTTALAVTTAITLVYKTIKTVTFISGILNSVYTFDWIPLYIYNSPLLKVFFDKKEVLEFHDRDFWYQIIFKNEAIISVKVKNSIDLEYELLSVYIRNLMSVKDANESAVVCKTVLNYIQELDNLIKI